MSLLCINWHTLGYISLHAVDILPKSLILIFMIVELVYFVDGFNSEPHCFTYFDIFCPFTSLLVFVIHQVSNVYRVLET